MEADKSDTTQFDRPAAANRLPLRPRFRFSLRTLLVLTVVIAIPLGWLGKSLDSLRRQRAVVAQLEAQHAEVQMAERFDEAGALAPVVGQFDRWFGGHGLSQARSVAWQDLNHPATDDQIALLQKLPTVEYVHVVPSKLTDAACHSLAALPKLNALKLRIAPFSAGGIAHLACCPRLRTLEFDGDAANSQNLRGLQSHADLRSLAFSASVFSDNDLRPLQGLQSLRSLSLDYLPHVTGECLQWLPNPSQLQNLRAFVTPINDAAVPHIAAMHRLQHIWFHSIEMTDAGFQQIGSRPELEALLLGDVRIGDKGLAALLAGSKISILSLTDVDITDESINAISRLERLEQLELSRSNITDAGLVGLQRCTRLESLEIGPHVSLSAAQQLKAALPACTIHVYNEKGAARELR